MVNVSTIIIPLINRLQNTKYQIRYETIQSYVYVYITTLNNVNEINDGICSFKFNPLSDELVEFTFNFLSIFNNITLIFNTIEECINYIINNIDTLHELLLKYDNKETILNILDKNNLIVELELMQY